MVRILCMDISGTDRAVYEKLYEAASPERKARADRCRRWEDKVCCVASEGLLRKVLGTADFEIGKGEWGKPYVMGREDFHYNISHSGRFLVLAWGQSPLGVDIQEHRDQGKLERLARRCFTEAEREYVRQDPDRFYEIWTGKESYLKYTGKGLGTDMRSFCVLEQRTDIRWTHIPLEKGYSLCLCSPEEEYALEWVDLMEI